MNKKEAYREAIVIASESYYVFKCRHEATDEASDPDLRRFYMEDEVKAAAATCAQQELVCRLFGVSEEQVHEDLEKLTGQFRKVG